MQTGLTRRRALVLAPLAAALVTLPTRITAQSIKERVERPDLGKHFVDAGVVGAMAVYEPPSGRLTLINSARAEQRFIPASTFKIVNSLIALDTGVVKDETEILPYGGKPTWNKAWARDMPLREAFALSNLPVFQGIARRVGIPRYVEWLAKLDYGNRQVGHAVDEFWLKGPLQISPVEQAVFAARLARLELPMSKRAQVIVREIARIESPAGKALFGKTGWTGKNGIGWLTGWTEVGGEITAFSLNMDMSTAADAPKRLDIARHILQALGRY